MQKKKILSGALVSLLAITVLGCQQAGQPTKPPQEVINDGVKKITTLTSYTYDVALKADVKDPEGKSGNFDVKLNGGVDIKNIKDPRLVVKLDGSAMDPTGKGGSASFELRLNKDAVYFNLLKLAIAGGEKLPEMVTPMLNKWWMAGMPVGVLDELAANMPGGSQDQLSAEQQKLRTLLEGSNIFAQPVFVGTDNVSGEPSYHYSVVVDNKALIQLMKKAAETEGKTISDAELQDAEKSLAKTSIKGDVWVGISTGILNKFSGDIKVAPSEGLGSGVINVTVTLGNFQKPINIDVPKDAEKFPVESVLPFLLGGGMETTSMYDVESDGTGFIDDSQMSLPLDGSTMPVDKGD